MQCERIFGRFQRTFYRFLQIIDTGTPISCVNTTPQMTRFRDACVCNNWLQVRIDDHRIQSDDKCTIGL